MNHRRPLRSAPILLFALALLTVAAACGGEAPLPAEKADFRLETLDGGDRLGPPDFPDQVVVVDFWATWCTPCRAQAEILDELHETWGQRGVQFLAVDVAEERATVEQFVEKNPFPYPVLLDPADRISADLGLMALPTLMVVDREGRVIYFEAGVVSKNEMERLLREAGATA